jgi:hypothetical protein
MRRVTEEKNMDQVRMVDWKESPEDVLFVVDEQLAEFGLEVVLVDLGSDMYVWRIERKMEDDGGAHVQAQRVPGRGDTTTSSTS